MLHLLCPRWSVLLMGHIFQVTLKNSEGLCHHEIYILSMEFCNYFQMCAKWKARAFVMWWIMLVTVVLIDKCTNNGAEMSCFVIRTHSHNDLVPRNKLVFFTRTFLRNLELRIMLLLSAYTTTRSIFGSILICFDMCCPLGLILDLVWVERSI